MPRDDLTIDFVKRMPQIEPLDPSLILDDWMNRVQNLPEEIRFMENEVADKDRQYNECIRMIEDRDGKIQKWIKSNGSHEPSPKEDMLRSQIRDNYARADQLSLDKIALVQKLQAAMDKHLRSLDAQLKLLYDRAEPGFTEPDEIPSLLRPSAANHSAPSARAVNPSAAGTTANSLPSPLGAAQGVSSNPATTRLPVHPSIRHAQAQQSQAPHSASAPTTPGATIILNRPREKSSGPTVKRGPRSTTGLGTVPAASSALARHSSLGPGSGRGGGGGGGGAAGEGRAGSAAPRAASVRSASGAGSRRSTPTASARKKVANKSSLSRVKKASARISPTSTADSDLSDAGSTSENDEERAADGHSGTLPASDSRDADDEILPDAEDEDASDDRRYCLCQNVSFGDMVACDNDNCPYEWFHWSCVGLKSEPTGTWYCPVCTEKFQKEGK